MQINENEWKELKKMLYETRDIVNSINEGLKGNEFNRGVIERVKSLEEKSKKTERMGWIVAGVMTVLLFIAKFGDNILNLLMS